MSYQIYKISTYSIPDNSYKINRDENWIITKVDIHPNSLEEAKNYVIEQSIIFSDLAIFTHNIQDVNDKNKFINEFCFTNDVYLKYRRFFIGYPPIKLIKNALIRDGVQISNK